MLLNSLFVASFALAAEALSADRCSQDSKVLSCHAKKSIPPSSCCYNGALVEGGKESGLILTTQFWDTNPSTGPEKSTTIHGLWPDYCDGTYPQYCSKQSGIKAFTGQEIRSTLAKYDPELLAYMDIYYKSGTGSDESFWEHEWQKHGTCFNTLKANCQKPLSGQTADEAALVKYFREVVDQFKAYPTYRWLTSSGIYPSSTKTYSLDQLLGPLTKKSGAEPYLGCTDGGTKLDEVWYYAHTYGPLAGGKYVPTDQTGTTSCKASGIKWLPKN